MFVIFLLITFCAVVNSDCNFHTNESNILLENLKKWGISNKIFTVKSSTSQYQIGICVAPDNSQPTGGIIQKENNETYILGQLNQATLIGKDNWLLLTYENGTRYINNTCDNQARSASIIFVCGQNTTNATVFLEHANKNEHCNYLFEIQVSGMCPVISEGKKKLSGGAIFLIIILCLASIYFIGGFLYMRIKCGARGIDQIPNLEMWRKFGQLAADGCDYCCRCNRTNAPRPGYFIDESGPDMRGDDDILAP